jgi:hypothetical protein
MRNRGKANRGRKPRASRQKTSVTNISFTETIIPNVVGGVALTVDLSILPTVFPWLTTSASVFSKYQLKKMLFTFVPAGASTYTGQIVGAFTYDSFENPPSSFSQVSQTAAHRIQTVHRRQSWSLDVTKTTQKIYPVVSLTSFLTIPVTGRVPYLPAIFHFANNSPNTQMLGSLQVTYSVDFSAPLFLSNTAPLINLLGTTLLLPVREEGHADHVPPPLTVFQADDIQNATPELLAHSLAASLV